MAEISKRLSAVSDSRGRIVSIFVGAVLLPSIALSVLSFNAVPKQAENLKLSLLRQAEQLLYYVEEDLEQATRRRALDAARAIDPELLLEGRPEAVRRALAAAGMAEVGFESLRLEAWSNRAGAGGSDSAGAELRALRAALGGRRPRSQPDDAEEDAVPLTTPGGEELGVVRFRFTCDYAHRQLVQEFFETGFANPGEAWVIRVSEPTGELLHENAATGSGERFEVERVMSAPSFEGVRLQLRYRDRSIEQEVRRLAIAKTALIGFIDLMLLAGLGLVWANVRRELRLSRLKSDFVANVSHELKTPLALIRLYAETLELGRVPNEGRKGEYYRVIGKESRRLTQLINNILDFSRIEAGRKEYRLVPSDIAAVVRDVVESYRFAIEKLGFSIELEIADELPALALDPEALSQALINLLNNAIKYSPERKAITVSLRREADRVRLAVSDRGIGIPRAEQRRIFEKFYRVETSLVHTTKGSGLGLALVQHIAEAHGGHVEVESTPGEGSTFALSLPLPEEAGAAFAPAPARASEPPAHADPGPGRGTMETREVEDRP
jgi:signal transduction histidine kinase